MIKKRASFYKLFALPVILLTVNSCVDQEFPNVISPQLNVSSQPTAHQQSPVDIIDEVGKTILTRFNVPQGYERIASADNSFGAYLQNLPLKPHGSLVKYYSGEEKSNYGVYEAVVDLEIGKRDLHQCADAIMRLWAEYWWEREIYEPIHFNFTNGFRVDYTEWMKGKRISVKGSKASWYQKGSASNTYNDFWKYMEIVFSYAGTLSLSKELKPVHINDMQIGDIFIQGGSPGHAVIVVDMAIDTVNDKKVYMLAQSYMPAQEIQILKNTSGDESPWYVLSDVESFRTPEWTFKSTDLKRFEK
ncbi:DUF4846 domain-containing protein [Crocinitomix catalasitica]|uniref:DUF4846 domain-containing protein n=1 Tax=Crocinitomix catalasitica TaxID=184607 RepID=UPI00048919CA|nr:DUF4846 domain-containing protein [Crocinitomix catalasitica]